jgi:hypothetical protein
VNFFGIDAAEYVKFLKGLFGIGIDLTAGSRIEGFGSNNEKGIC